MDTSRLNRTLASKQPLGTGTSLTSYGCSSSQQSTSESTALKNLESSELKNKIDLLPPLKQKILELKYNFDFSYQEIAEIMNLELGTVKSQLFRAKEELKTLISNS